MCRLYLGDNLQVMRSALPEGGVDLFYLDPPFNTRSVFRVRHAGRPEVHAYDDRWRWDEAAREALVGLLGGSPPVAALASALQGLLGPGNQLAYLALLGERLVEVARLLSPAGSVYLHCDPRMSHLLRLLMDAVFGREALQNEIIWSYRSGGGSRRRFGRKHDVLLFYAPGAGFTFNADAVRTPYAATIATRRRQLFHPLGKVMGDVWDIPRPPNHAAEWTGYPTQKPERLLERVILASSNPGDLVCDPFCGSGTTLAVAGRLGRRWVGIDSSPEAISLATRRLREGTQRSAGGGGEGAAGGGGERSAGGGGAFDVIDFRRPPIVG